jgi:glycyl-tRNA synthetase beta chain
MSKEVRAAASETLLIELLTEELPPKALGTFDLNFYSSIFEDLGKLEFVAPTSVPEHFATPRRLAVVVPGVRAKQPEQRVERKGPSVGVGLDAAGNPTPALLGFAKSCGVSVQRLGRARDAKGEYFQFRSTKPGETLSQQLPAILEKAIKKLSTSTKVMRWGSGDAEFLRPVHGLLVMHGARPVKLSRDVLGFGGGTNRTRGHRFMGEPEVRIKEAAAYAKTLERDGRVLAAFAARKERIRKELEKKAGKAKILADDVLLDEVTALVEWPEVFAGSFSDEFLVVPQECLVLSMRQHQRYFPLADAQGRLLPRFLMVSNVPSPRSAHIVRGNERVLRARLADAKFFYDQDRKQRLETRVPQLSKVVHHNKLGSQLERVERIQLLAGKIARDLNADPAPAERAAWLSKADLLTGMVGEFPELQGVMGRYYARHDGEPEEICDAIEQHYWPRYAGDGLPQVPVAFAVALADRLDTLVGIFGIGLVPTGDKDPFALRRLALGVIRILCEHKLALDVNELLRAAHGNYPKGKLLESHKHGSVSVPNPIEVGFFVADRARNYLREAGYATLEVESVLDLAPKPAEYVDRLEAVRSFLKLPEAAALAESDKRIRNILNKSGGASVVQPTNVSILQEEAEKQLLGTTRLLRQEVESMLKEEKFREALVATARIHQPVAEFFDKVLVNASDEKVRMNRFALLHEVIGLTNRVANISKLAA